MYEYSCFVLIILYLMQIQKNKKKIKKKKKRKKYLLTVAGLMDAKYGLINGKLYQTIGVINLKEIKNWNKIKKSLQQVNVNFQALGDNRDVKHLSYNFITKNTGDVLNYAKTNR